MSSLIGRFMRDLPFLREGLVPQEEGGLAVDKLKYEGEEHEKLTDQDVKDLADALLENDQFKGELKLNNNDLTDLAALHLAPVFEKQNAYNITKLKMDGNNFTTKAGEYIGTALCTNPSYKIKTLSFSGISLESIGLVRIIEACNGNENIKKLNIGVLTDEGLEQLALLLAPNNSLEELEIQETKNHQKLWTDRGRNAFIEMLKNGTVLKKVGLHFTKDDDKDSDKEFKAVIKFYTKMKSKAKSLNEDYRKIMRSCDPSQMFENLQELIENNDDMHHMPVRKFYNNTFNTLLNRAIFELIKSQNQHPDNMEYFTTEGMIRIVAMTLLNEPPDGEIEQNLGSELDNSV